MSSDPYTVNAAGERVIAASRRPDGTIRKERRVRAGYVAQDEVAVYQSRGVQARQNIPKCPGLDDSEEPPKPKTKSAAKNEKRKQKKLEEKAAAEVASSGSQAAAAIQNLSISGGEAGGAAAGEPPSLEKQVRALKKKIRQAAELAAQKAEGKALSDEQEAKLARMAAWEEEVRQLEAQM